MTKKFWRYYINRAKRYFETNRRARILVVLSMVLTIVSISIGIFYLTRQGLQATQNETDAFIVKAVPLFIYEVFLLIIGFLIFVSTIIFGLFNFFKGEDDTWIMVSPEYKKLSWINFFQAIVHSSWPTIIIAIPLLLAVQSVFSLSFFSLLLAFVVVALFTFFAGGIAIVLIFLLSLLMKLLKQKSFSLLAFLMAISALFVGVFVWLRLIGADLNEIFQIREAVDPALTLMIQNFSIFPSHYPAMSIFYLQQGEFALAFQYAGIMFVLFALVIISFSALKEKFLYIWQTFQEGSFEAKNKKLQTRSKLFLKTFPTSPEGVISKKEFLSGVRSSKNFFWFLFLTILLLAQVGVLNLLARYGGVGQDEVFEALIPALQLGMILFFICAFILRFVFTSFSQEGSTSWILGAAPIDFKSVFYAKYRFYSILVVLMSIFSLTFYIIPLSVDIGISLTLVMITVLSVLTLTMLGLSLGVIFANFETNDPHMLSTSASGIGFTLASLGYSALGGYLFYIAIMEVSYIPILLFIIISVSIYWICNHLALKALEKIEFV